MERDMPEEDDKEGSKNPLQSCDGLGDIVVIKSEPVDNLVVENDLCSSTLEATGIASSIQTVQATSPTYPSMVCSSVGRIYDGNDVAQSQQENSIWSSNRKSPFERFRDQVLSAIRAEYPTASEDDAYHIAARRWNLLNSEQRKNFGYAESNSQGSRKLRGVHYDVTEDDEDRDSPVSEPRSEVPKFGRCTWCKSYGSLNDYSANLQKREIYCTGLCSKQCFEQAALKIINVETGCGLENLVYPERTPIRTSINLSNLCGESSSSRGGRMDNVPMPRSDNSGAQTRTMREGPLPRPRPVVARSGSILQASHAIRLQSMNAESASTPEQHGVVSMVEPSYGMGEAAFNWVNYLKQTSSASAPLSCFRQSRTPSTNLFKVGMKLEAKDPRNESAVCVATVAAICGPRLRLHLDGCARSEDIWVLCDSSDIQPVGWYEGNRGSLQKPKGFLIEGMTYSEYIKKALISAELAPMSAFKSEPSPLKGNKFTTGMKLEAVDKKNPAMIRVASIAEVDGDRVRIEFDGAKGTGYWTHYNDRDLFQAGWCFNNGYPLQPPGVPVIRPQPIVPHNNVSSGNISPSLKEKRSHLISSGHGEVDVTVNNGCNPGPYLNPKKVSLIPSAYKGFIGVVLKAVLEDLIRCAYDPKTVLGFLKPGRGNVVINAVADGVVYNCYLSTVDRVSTFWKVMEQFCDNLRCCTNLVSGFELQTACPQCGRTGQPAKGQRLPGKRTHGTSDASTESSLPVCISSTPDSTAVNAADITEARADSREFPKRKRRNSVQSHVTSAPRSWSVDYVAEFIEKTDLKEYSDVFRDNDIDGKALLLLKRDIVISYMGLKLGPAVKLLDLIDELREADTHFRY